MLSRRAFSICIAAMLAGCGGSQPPIGVYGTTASTQAVSRDKVFKYTGGKQSFKVPADVTHVTITAYGAGGAPGGNFASGDQALGGKGGDVTATIPVTPGERLAIFVGGKGEHGGFNGGGSVPGRYRYGFGGGASDVRQGGDQIANRVVVAGGGGGAGGTGAASARGLGGAGGAGGGRRGGSGGAGEGTLTGGGGTGGKQHIGGNGGAGGASSCGGSDGTLGVGGEGGGSPSVCGTLGGGGGGGYFGGGGGGGGGFASSSNWGAGGGGGGGSAFAETSATHVKMFAGTNDGNGSILILW